MQPIHFKEDTSVAKDTLKIPERKIAHLPLRVVEDNFAQFAAAIEQLI